MKMIKMFLSIAFAFSLISCSAQTSIEGVVLSQITQKPIGFVNVVVKYQGKMITGANTDKQGKFQIQVEKSVDSVVVEAYKVGFSNTDTTLFIEDKKKKEVRLWLGGVNTDSLLFDGNTAKKDLKQGIVRIYSYGMPGISLDKMNQVAQKYGFKYEFLTCEIDETLIESVKRYNQVVMEYLSEKNEEGWQDSLLKEIKSFK